MRKTLLTFAQTAALVALISPAGADQLLSNFDQPYNDSAWTPDPFTLYIQHFTSGPEFVQLQSVTLDQLFYDPAQPSVVFVQVYRADDSELLGALPNFATNSTATVNTGYTFIDYSPDAPIDLATNTEYFLLFSQSTSAFPTAFLALTGSDQFTAVPGWSLGATYSRWFSAWDTLETSHFRVQLNGAPFIPNNPPPDITGAHASLSVLWPPNGKMVPLTIEGITDPDPNSVTVTITGIQQNQPVANRPGDTSPDSWIGANGSFALKAERLADGSGRVYAVSFVASNGQSSVDATGTVYVTVPSDVEQLGAAGLARPSHGSSRSTKR